VSDTSVLDPPNEVTRAAPFPPKKR
jgi:hypothetical protein